MDTTAMRELADRLSGTGYISPNYVRRASEVMRGAADHIDRLTSELVQARGERDAVRVRHEALWGDFLDRWVPAAADICTIPESAFPDLQCTCGPLSMAAPHNPGCPMGTPEGLKQAREAWERRAVAIPARHCMCYTMYASALSRNGKCERA